MSTAIEPSRETTHASRGALWFGLLAGAFAWVVHLMGAYAVAEFGCVAGLAQYEFVGVSLVAWLLIGLSVIAALVAAVGTSVALMRYCSLRREEPNTSPEIQRALAAVARTGLITSGLFLLVIVVESLPIIYYLSNC